MAYPSTLDSFTTKVDNVDDVEAAHVNALQTAVVAIETELGTQPRHTATAAPTVNDDSGDGYSVGTHWHDTTADRIYVCIDATVGAAVWHNVGSPWVTWTPTVTQSGSVTVTVTRARYKIVNKIAHVEVQLDVTGSGTGGQSIVIAGQPSAMQAVVTGEFPIGIANIRDTGTAMYSCQVHPISATTWYFHYAGSSGDGVYAGANPNFALANGDVIRITATYEVA